MNNIANSKRYIYDTPIKDGNVWVAWYFGELDEAVITEKAVDVLKENK